MFVPAKREAIVGFEKFDVPHPGSPCFCEGGRRLRGRERSLEGDRGGSRSGNVLRAKMARRDASPP
jgi:hypothetical protein